MSFNILDGGYTLYAAELIRADSPVWSMGWELWFSLTLPLALTCLGCIHRDKSAFFLIIWDIFLYDCA